MKIGLRRQTFLIIVSICLVLIVSLMLSSRLLILTGFRHLETEHVQQDVAQAWHFISKDIQWLASIAGDWAPWDDTYGFVQDQNTRYIDSNLSVETIANLGIHFMLFVDPAGRQVHTAAIDLKKKEAVILPKGVWDQIRSKKALFEFPDPRQGVSGFFMFEHQPVLIASHAIVPSNYQGPPRGTLVVGRFLDPSEIKKITDAAGLSLSIHAADSTPLPDDVKKAASLISDKTPVVTLPQNKEIISGYMVCRDIQQNPGFILKIDVTRKIFKQGMNTWLYFNIAVVFIGVVFVLATMYLMERSVLSPLLRIIEKISAIDGSDNVSKRLPVSGTGELGKLELSINGMLDRIQRAHNEIKTLEGLIPICSYCKNIRDDEGFWQKVDHFIHHRTDARFSHGICPECAEKHFPEMDLYNLQKKCPPGNGGSI
ncbi:CHASE4 domain-containing protein [Desulfotignum phosphitoxidans]|jgi:sensor domain CHASE-containing protein|uniref:Putative histidine kinase n=1 Tax=Desulfotignum phosphitoxidans DSM 13687 TaxID=1286635 RepID=S0FXY7_9BACT|nr:CHASE4 domain-containing protein [Desulfotignum phosphitoxidans]EMS79933.1 putative histidine kinase [Desulfotignum phosphitoxidans DSM 13687]